MILQRQEQDEQTPRVPLLLHWASISLDGDELNSHGKKSLATRVWFCGVKFKGHRPLFIGLLAPNHSRYDLLQTLSRSRIKTRLIGLDSRGERSGKANPDSGSVNPASSRCLYSGRRPGWGVGRAGSKLHVEENSGQAEREKKRKGASPTWRIRPKMVLGKSKSFSFSQDWFKFKFDSNFEWVLHEP
jgi:hypothetical protein